MGEEPGAQNKELIPASWAQVGLPLQVHRLLLVVGKPKTREVI